MPGLSDHDIPLLDISTKISINKKAPRKVYLYRKGNMEGLVSDLTNFSIKFCKNYDNPKAQDVNICGMNLNNIFWTPWINTYHLR